MRKNKINIILTVVFGSFVLISFLLLCFNLNSSEFVAVTSALISLSGGGLVSVIVTWFINAEQNRREDRQKELIRDSVLLPTYNTLLAMIYNFSRLCDIAKANTERNEEKTWKEWLNILTVALESSNLENQRNCMLSLGATFNNMKNRTFEIRSNRVELFIEKMISNEEYYALCELDFLSEKIKHVAMNNDIGGTVSELTEFSLCGEKIFEKINCGVRLNEIKYTTQEFWKFMKETDGGKIYIRRADNK